MPSIIIIIRYLVVLHVMLRLDCVRQLSENTDRLNSIRRIPQWETSITQLRRNIKCNTNKCLIIIILGILIIL